MFSALLEAAAQFHYTYTPPRLHSDAAKQWVDWDESGEYWADHFELVPLEKIHYKEWAQDRSDRLLPKMQAGTPIDPVTLSLREDGHYNVSDGNHRCSVSVDLGYTHVPAVVSQKHTEEPAFPSCRDVQIELSGRELFYLIDKLRNLDMGPEVQYQWKSAGQHDYALTAVHDDGREVEVRVVRRESIRIAYIGKPPKVSGREVFAGFNAATMADWVLKKLKVLL